MRIDPNLVMIMMRNFPIMKRRMKEMLKA